MRKQELEITISPTGQVSFQIKGVKGPQCLAETQFLEEALGGVVLEREHTTEFYEQSEGGHVSSRVGGDDD